jgi:hypothetical protein
MMEAISYFVQWSCNKSKGIQIFSEIVPSLFLSFILSRMADPVISNQLLYDGSLAQLAEPLPGISPPEVFHRIATQKKLEALFVPLYETFQDFMQL